MNKDIMRAVGFGKYVEDVENNLCPFCRAIVLEIEFRDEISRKEFKISGLCQKCQDKTFG